MNGPPKGYFSLLDATLAAPRPDELEEIMRHTPEKLDKIIEAVRQHNGPPWITNINKLNRVFQAAHNLVYGVRTIENIEILLEAVQEAEKP